MISYANKPFYRSQQDLKDSALKYGINDVVDYNEPWLKKTDFYKKNKKILQEKRGGGYWLWKPYIILDALKNMEDGDILIHIDAGTLFIDDPSAIIKLTDEKGLLLFYNNGHKNKTWTKRDCFVYMDCDDPKYYEGYQLLAGYIFCKKSPAIVKLLTEWLAYSEDERIISDNPNTCGLPDIEGFISHRHDQSVLSNLAIKYNLELFRDPSQWGNKYKSLQYRVKDEFAEDGYADGMLSNSPYPTILYGHRTKRKLSLADQWNYFILQFKSTRNRDVG